MTKSNPETLTEVASSVTIDETDVSLYGLSKTLTAPMIASIFENWANSMSRNPKRDGEIVGRLLSTAHRTLQGCAVNFFISVLISFDTAWSDPRNDVAMDTCRKIKALVDRGEIKWQPFI